MQKFIDIYNVHSKLKILNIVLFQPFVIADTHISIIYNRYREGII